MRDMRAVVIILAKNNHSPPQGWGGGDKKALTPKKFNMEKNKGFKKPKNKDLNMKN